MAPKSLIAASATCLRASECDMLSSNSSGAWGILCEIVNLVTLGFFFGTFWALQGMIARGQTFYDEWMDLEVEDLNPVGLTPTHKNFRKYMRQQARLKGR
jgi:hypothetical protein